MKNTNFRKFAATFLTICSVIFGLTVIANAAVKPDLLSKASNGDNGNGNSRNISVSANGRYVVFESAATNLVSGLTDTNNAADIFLRDTQTGTLRCISLANATTTGSSFSVNPIISANGRYVVFASGATNLISTNDTNNDLDVFRFDIITNQMQLVSINITGTSTGNGYSGNTLGGWHTYDMSDDGRYVAFMSNAFDLTFINDTNSKSDVFIRDMQTNSTRLASINMNGTGTGNNESVDVSITADGQTIAFTSFANDLVTADTNGQYDVFVYNYQTQITKCVSRRPADGITGTFSSGPALISKNGNRVAFFSTAHDLSNISIPFNNPFSHIYVHDIGFNTNFLVSVNSAGNAAANNEVGIGSRQQVNLNISADGRYVTFDSRATNLVANATSATYNIYRRDLSQGRTEVVSINTANTQNGTQNSFNGLRGSGMSSDGRYVVFYGNSSNLTVDFPTVIALQVFVRDMVSGITTALTLNNSGNALGNTESGEPHISANGKSVVFISIATDLTPTHTNSFVDAGAIHAARRSSLFPFSKFSTVQGELSMTMKLRPLHDRVIVKRLEEERKTASGIVIPDTATEKPDQGEVLAVGPGKRDDSGKVHAVDLKVGDKVLFGKYAGQTVKVDGDELMVMREEDIMAVVQK